MHVVWNRCTGMGKALLLLLLLRSMQQIGGDCLWPVSGIHKERQQRWWKGRMETASLGPTASPRARDHPAAFGIHWMWSGCSSSRTDRQRNKPTERLTDKFSLSGSQSMEPSSIINYSILQLWPCFKLNRMFAKSVLHLQIFFWISLLLFELLFPFFFFYLLLLHAVLHSFSLLQQTIHVCVSSNIFSRSNVLKHSTFRLQYTES